MDMTEELRQQAADNGAEVIDWKFQTDRIKGLYCNGVIAVSKDIDTSAERACVIAEELGHHLTASGNTMSLSPMLWASRMPTSWRWEAGKPTM